MSAETHSDEVSRRDFLRMGGLSVLGLSAGEATGLAAAAPLPRRCIFLLLVGGPSQLETFDPKPHAPLEVRGPFRPIPTAVPGVYFSETLPLLAERAERLMVLRSLHHDAAPLHETGLQIVQTGRLVRRNFVPPSLGAIVQQSLGPHDGLPAQAVLPRKLSLAGSTWHGQGGGSLGPEFDPPSPADGNAAYESLWSGLDAAEIPETLRRAYGDTPFGWACLAARQLSAKGTRFVTVNMFDGLTGGISWDCHAHRSAPTTLLDYRHTVCAEFDRVLSALLDDLHETGLLAETLVVAAGEFGRTPRINSQGGRDHWPGVWSAVVAGAGLAGGRVIGSSDARAALPADRPIHPGELSATILQVLGADPKEPLAGTDRPRCDHAPLCW